MFQPLEFLLRRECPGPQHPDQRPIEPQACLQHPPGINFANILRKAFKLVVPKSAKMTVISNFERLGSKSIKAASKHIGEIDPSNQMRQHFMSSISFIQVFCKAFMLYSLGF